MTLTLTKYSEPELNAAFKRVQPADWRDPINCMIAESNFEELEKTRQAVEFYTATKCLIVWLFDTTYRITAAGYRNGPAGP